MVSVVVVRQTTTIAEAQKNENILKNYPPKTQSTTTSDP
jgi:hypothetical protein